jgi:hypothetical protein
MENFPVLVKREKIILREAQAKETNPEQVAEK